MRNQPLILKCSNFFHQHFRLALVCNILEVMMKPNFEPPAHTLRQILDRNLTLYMFPGTYGMKVSFARSDFPEFREIAETMIITKSYEEYDNLTKHGLLSSGTHTMVYAFLYDFEYPWGREYNHGRGYYRGELMQGDYPYNGHLTSKNWHLNEEFKNLKNKVIQLIKNCQK